MVAITSGVRLVPHKRLDEREPFIRSPDHNDHDVMRTAGRSVLAYLLIAAVIAATLYYFFNAS